MATSMPSSLASIQDGNSTSSVDRPSSPEPPRDRLFDPPTWVARILKQGAWDEAADPLSLRGASALPMPVKVAEPSSLAPFFAHVRNGGRVAVAGDKGTLGTEPHYAVELIEFDKGVLYADGRVDLCKMVTGPRNIGDLMDALRPNSFVKHFLLGNNIISFEGARAIARFIQDFPNRFETWYLAGNCIDISALSILVDSMVKSPVITNIWLKRNPLGPAAASAIFNLITQSPALRALDLDQTELGDAGVARLFDMLSRHDKPVALRHIYLNGTGIGAAACSQIAQYLWHEHCQLESLYMSNNPIGTGIAELAEAIADNTTLQRLSLQSCGLKDEGTTEPLAAVTRHPSIKVLDIGQAYATEDLGMRFNWLACAEALVELIEHTDLHFLNVSLTPMAQLDLNSVLRAAGASSSLLWFNVRPLVTGGRTHAEIKAGLEGGHLRKLVRERLHANVARAYDGLDYKTFEKEHKRFLISPQDVRLIDSVYRNRDAGLARRGLKFLDKWWDEDDETLRQVQSGVVK